MVAAAPSVVEVQRVSEWSWTQFAYVFIVVVIVAITSFMAGMSTQRGDSVQKGALRAAAVSVPLALTAAVLAK